MQLSAFKRFVLRLIGIKFNVYSPDDMHKQFNYGYQQGFKEGELNSKVKFAVLPLPFTAEQLQAREYGNFITPRGFAVAFGECTVPAPGPHGYEQRAYYVDKNALSLGVAADLLCHNPDKFDKPSESDALVPVIVTVLR